MKVDHKRDFLVFADMQTIKYLFDFDGTICFSGEFNEQKLNSPSENKKITNKILELLDDNQDVSILTARKNMNVVQDYLESIDFPEIEIIALGNPSNRAKGDYILKHFSGYDQIYLYDDRKEYLDYAENLLRESGIGFVPVLVEDERSVKASKKITATPADAWHGSPYEFDKFTTEKIGTGEGAQAFGWGLYFTEKESIADHYKNVLTRNKRSQGILYTVDGFPVKIEDPIYSQALEWVADEGYQKALSDWEVYAQEDYYEWRPDYPAILKAVKSLEGKKVRRVEASKYKVTLWKDKQEKLLDWDDVISKQPQEVQNVFDKYHEESNAPVSDDMEAIFKDDPYGLLNIPEESTAKDFTLGKQFYIDLSKKLGSDKAASEALLAEGVDGIRYKSEGGVGDAYNYVVFDENDVTTEQVIKGSLKRKAFSGEQTISPVYHGTNYEFDKFSHTGDKLTSMGRGHYFSPDKETAKLYGDRIITAELSGNFLDWNNPPKEVIEELETAIPADRRRGYGPEASKFFPYGEENAASKFASDKRNEMKDVFHDRAKPDIREVEGGYEIFWREPGLDKATPDNLFALMNEYYQSISADMGYNGAISPYGEIVVYSPENIRIINSEWLKAKASKNRFAAFMKWYEDFGDDPLPDVEDKTVTASTDLVEGSTSEIKSLQKELKKLEDAWMKKARFMTDMQKEEYLNKITETQKKLFKLTGDPYGLTSGKTKTIVAEPVNYGAEYNHPSELPLNVYEYAKKQNLLYSDANDAIRLSRIIDTVDSLRYSGQIEIFRAIERGGFDEIRPGDWVTTEESYAKKHNDNYFNGSGKILNAVVDGRDVLQSPTGDREEALYAPIELSQPYKTYKKKASKNRFAALLEEEDPYLKVVEAGDMETAQKMVDEAAKAAGYNTKAFHGTNTEFNEFTESKEGVVGRGIYITPFYKSAANYGKKVLNLYAKLENPLTVEYRDIPMAVNMRQRAEMLGHDSIIVSSHMRGEDFSEASVFSPEQVKSADPVTYDDSGNIIPLKDRFNSGSKDIRASQKIKAAKQVGTLYHFTPSVGKLKSILRENKLKAREEETSISGDPLGISFTRNPNSTEFGKIRLVIDGNKLSERYKIQPYNDNKNLSNYKHSVDTDTDEMEERIQKKEILNIRDYIKQVDILDVKARSEGSDLIKILEEEFPDIQFNVVKGFSGVSNLNKRITSSLKIMAAINVLAKFGITAVKAHQAFMDTVSELGLTLPDFADIDNIEIGSNPKLVKYEKDGKTLESKISKAVKALFPEMDENAVRSFIEVYQRKMAGTGEESSKYTFEIGKATAAYECGIGSCVTRNDVDTEFYNHVPAKSLLMKEKDGTVVGRALLWVGVSPTGYYVDRTYPSGNTTIYNEYVAYAEKQGWDCRQGMGYGDYDQAPNMMFTVERPQYDFQVIPYMDTFRFGAWDYYENLVMSNSTDLLEENDLRYSMVFDKSEGYRIAEEEEDTFLGFKEEVIQAFEGGGLGYFTEALERFMDSAENDEEAVIEILEKVMGTTDYLINTLETLAENGYFINDGKTLDIFDLFITYENAIPKAMQKFFDAAQLAGVDNTQSLFGPDVYTSFVSIVARVDIEFSAEQIQKMMDLLKAYDATGTDISNINIGDLPVEGKAESYKNLVLSGFNPLVPNNQGDDSICQVLISKELSFDQKVDTLDFLVERGYDLTTAATYIYYMVMSNSANDCAKLLDKYKFKVGTYTGTVTLATTSPIFWLITNFVRIPESLEKLEVILKYGADPNVRAKDVVDGSIKTPFDASNPAGTEELYGSVNKNPIYPYHELIKQYGGKPANELPNEEELKKTASKAKTSFEKIASRMAGFGEVKDFKTCPKCGGELVKNRGILHPVFCNDCGEAFSANRLMDKKPKEPWEMTEEEYREYESELSPQNWEDIDNEVNATLGQINNPDPNLLLFIQNKDAICVSCWSDEEFRDLFVVGNEGITKKELGDNLIELKKWIERMINKDFPSKEADELSMEDLFNSDDF